MTSPVPASVQMADSVAAFQRLRELSLLRSHRVLSEDELKELEQSPICIHCGGFHARACPRVRRIAFHPGSGQVAEVEYWPHSRVNWDGVLFEDQGADAADLATAGWFPVSLVRRLLAPFGTGKNTAYLTPKSDAWEAARQLLDLLGGAAVQSRNDSAAGPSGRRGAAPGRPG